MSDLRTRIAKVLYERNGMARLAWNRPWESLHADVQALWLADADAVIAELNLHRNDEEDEYGGYKPTGRYRYVTDWKANNE